MPVNLEAPSSKSGELLNCLGKSLKVWGFLELLGFWEIIWNRETRVLRSAMIYVIMKA